MADSNSIDIPLLRVPFESLKRVSRDRKYIIDDLDSLIFKIKELAKSTCSGQERQQGIQALILRGNELKAELTEKEVQEKADAERCKQRLRYLKELGAPAKDHTLDWSRQRLPRILADHLLRSGHTETAKLLSTSFDLQGLTDDYIFEEAQPILQSLKRQDCKPALDWCHENRVRLKKMKSKLEFRLRTQEFVELVRAGERMKAIQHSQTHLQPWAILHAEEFHQAMGSLVFGQTLECNPYTELFDAAQWDKLAQLFYQELFRLHSMPQQSLLKIELQAGLSALKAPSGSGSHESKEDPLHSQYFQALAKDLPYAKHVHSRLVCAITKELMNENNPPMVLPSGTVYSEKAIRQRSANGQFVEPSTGYHYTVAELRRAYIS